MKDKGILIQLISISVCIALLVSVPFYLQEQIEAEETPKKMAQLINIPEPKVERKELIYQVKETLPELTYQKGLTRTQIQCELQLCENYVIIYRHKNKKNLDKKIYDIEIIKNKYYQDLYKWDQKAKKYPVAVKIWDYLKTEMNLSDVAAAGIMGNIMVEAGG